MQTLDELEKILLKYRSKRFLVIEPGGNNGDRLLYLGLERKLSELGIDYTVLKYEENPKFSFLHVLYFGFLKRILNVCTALDKFNNSLDLALNKIDNWIYVRTLRANKIKVNPEYVILIHGGANINDFYGHGIRLLNNVIQNNPNSIIIVGPQTYWFRETCFPKLFLAAKQEIYLFCREKYSYNLLSSMTLPKNVHISLSYDTLFYLSKREFHPRQGAYDLICFRTDRESTLSQKQIAQLPRNRLINLNHLKQSKKGIVAGDISLLNDFDDFVNLIEGSRKVFTDRLHVAILSTIIGKDTVLYSNSYYKNKGVYEFSLSKCPNIKFIDNPKHFKTTVKRICDSIMISSS